MDVGQQPAELALPLLGWQPCVDGQVLHHIEITAHLVSQSCQQQSLCQPKRVLRTRRIQPAARADASPAGTGVVAAVASFQLLPAHTSPLA